MDIESCRKIVELFEAIRARPAMYTGKSYDYARTIQLITGFRLAIAVTSQIDLGLDDVKTAYFRRGWNEVYFGAVEEMKAKGLEGDEITRELLSVEIDFWNSHCERLS